MQVFVEVDPHHFIRREKTVLDSLFEGVAVHRLTEVGDAGHLFGFLRCGGEADMGGAGEVVKNLAPSGILGGTATVAFVDHNQVEEVSGKLFVDVHFFFSARHGLIERKVNLVRGINLTIGDLGHRLAEGLEIVVLGLVDQDVAVGQEENSLLLLGLPQPPDNLEGGVGLAGAGGHDQQDA
ncbi:hypothetical protein D3C84_834410 [compost metagenome]